MPQGDAQRAWFPEMLRELPKKWSPEMSWTEWSELCVAMTRRRNAIRKKRGITGPWMKCRGCGGVHEMGPPPVSIRSLLFALEKAGLLEDGEFATRDKEWKKYQRSHGLDCYGKPKAKASGSRGEGGKCSP